MYDVIFEEVHCRQGSFTAPLSAEDASSASANVNGWQLAKMKKSIPDMSLQ